MSVKSPSATHRTSEVRSDVEYSSPKRLFFERPSEADRGCRDALNILRTHNRVVAVAARFTCMTVVTSAEVRGASDESLQRRHNINIDNLLKRSL